ncbi:hypothetical protein BT69DRAFT_541465 [Atractiella rhizophila]|nr:hypothetical protein BT69DRAFT_541465 [Atractiella rhizophila]
MPLPYDKVTLSLLGTFSVASLLFALTSTQYHLRLPLAYFLADPTYQWYRLITHQLGFTQSSELFIAAILLSQMSGVERILGTRRFARLVVQTILFYPIFLIAILVALQKLGWSEKGKVIEAGGWAIVGAVGYQYHELIPATLNARVFSLPLTNKSISHLLFLQVIVLHPLPTTLGILISLLFRHTRLHHLSLPTLPIAPLFRTLSPSTSASISASQTSTTAIPAAFGSGYSPAAPSTADGEANDSVLDRFIRRTPNVTVTAGRIGLLGSLTRRGNAPSQTEGTTAVAAGAT